MFAERVGRIAASPTVKLSNLVSEMVRSGVNVVSFAIGEPDFPTPKHIVEAAVEALNKGFTHYTPSMGIPELREAIAERTKSKNKIPCTSRNVMVTPTKFGVYLAMTTCVQEGDEVILPDPCWVTYEPCVTLAGGKAVYAVTKEEENFALTQDTLQKLINPRTKMIVINTPSNPTGAVYTKDELKVVADLTKDHNLLVLSDEVYEDLVYEGQHHSIASMEGMFDRAITVSGFSKSYAMTGWRMGWMIAPELMLKEMDKIQQHSITCASSFSQKAGVAALKGDQTPLKKMVEDFRARRDMVCAGLEKISGFRCAKPSGAFYVFPSYMFNMKSLEFSEFLLKEARVAVTPGSSFGPSGEKHVRISYATSRENLEEGLRRIGEAVANLERSA